MNFKPARGTIFLVPIDEIAPAKPEMGFGSKKEKHKPEEPYKFRVVSVGGPLPFDGMFIDPEVAAGDVVSLNYDNETMRERMAAGAGFLVDGVWHYGIDFRDILGIWRDNEETYTSDIPF
jgi:hypothetical protein